jgi:hypothetical protein
VELDAEAVELHLMQPLGPRWRSREQLGAGTALGQERTLVRERRNVSFGR